MREHQGTLFPRTRRWGIGLALATAVVSGFAIFANGYAVRSWKEVGVGTATYTTAKNLVAALLLGTLLIAFSARRSREGFTRPTSKGQWASLMAIGVIGGAVPFLLFFEGLSRANSAQAALLHKTLIVWVAVLAIPLLKEGLSALHFGAIGLLLAGQVALAGGTDIAFGSGELMILGATLMWSIEVIIAKRLLDSVSALTVGAARMGLGVVVLIGYGIVTGAFSQLAALGASQWAWALGTGVILTTYVAIWYQALARAQAIDVTAVLVLGAVITALLRSGFNAAPLQPQALGLVLISLGVVVVGALAWRRPMVDA